MASNLPSISTSCNNKCTTVTVGDLAVTFSYTTPVAFYHPRTGQVVSANVWSMTTGRHLNEVDGGDKRAKERRFPHTTFATLLDLVSKGDGRSLAKAERIANTHRALCANGMKVAG